MGTSQNIQVLLTLIANKSDEKAFKELFDLFAHRLYHFSFSFLKNKPLAEEAVSDVFLKVWQNRETLPHIENIKAYLFKATYNTSLNYLDEAKRKTAVSLEEVEVNIGVDLLSPETDLINKELKEIIDQAIESLPPRCKIIYQMAKVEQMKYKEIADLLEISVKTIDNQLTIAIKKLGETIKKYLSQNDDQQDFMILFKVICPLPEKK